MDDGSTDGTATLLDAFAASEAHVRTLRFERNRGKERRFVRMLAANSQLALMTDVDLSTPLEDVALLAQALEDGADIAIASRGLRESKVLVHQPGHRELMGKAFNLGVRMLTRVPWRDTQCGFKLFRHERTRRVFELQRVEGFAFDVEVLVMARRLGLHVSEVPVHWIDHPDTRVGVVTSSTAMALDVLRIASPAAARCRQSPAPAELSTRRPGSRRR